MQTWKKYGATVLAFLLSVSPLSACGGTGEDGSSVDSLMESSETATGTGKTELRVSFTNAGFGDGWTAVLEKDFEEKMKDVSFEKGKRGVNVVFEEQTYVTPSGISSGSAEVYFIENPNDLVELTSGGVLEPLDTLMNTPNPDDGGQKIADKVSAQHKEAYSYGGKQYYLPYYIGSYGIVYNRDLFDERGFYFAETPDLEQGNLLIDEIRTEKTAGPDGKKGTDDDGLPTTYDEFFYLCKEINAVGIDPVCFTGQYSAWHLGYLMDALVVNYEGAEQGRLNYTFSGKAQELVVFNDDGSIKRENGEIVTESAEITPENGYETARQIGKYYALQFVEKLFGDKTYYNEDDGEDETVSYTDMQRGFLEDGTLGGKESAMLVDGTWWQREADGVFERMAKTDAKYSKENRRFGWLPLPQPTQAEADKIKNGERKSVYGDQISAVSCIKAGLTGSKKKAALEFIKYAYSDEALANFTYEVGATIGVDYLDALEDDKLTPYEKSYVEYLKRSDIVYPVSTASVFATKRNAYRAHTKYTSVKYGDITKAFMHGEITAEEYFIDHQTEFKRIAWTEVK